MEHDVEAETEGHDEERVPEQEGEEGLEDLEDGNGGFDYSILGRNNEGGEGESFGCFSCPFSKYRFTSMELCRRLDVIDI